MFLFRADRYLKELESQQPEMMKACLAAWKERNDDMDFTRVGAENFRACPDDSIDYAVMEKTHDAVVVPLDAGWSDVAPGPRFGIFSPTMRTTTCAGEM